LLSCEAAEDRDVEEGGREYRRRGMVSATPAKEEGSTGASPSTNSSANISKSAEKGSSNGVTEVDHRSAISVHRLVSRASWWGGNDCEEAMAKRSESFT
jgi:hypothetical protein